MKIDQSLSSPTQELGLGVTQSYKVSQSVQGTLEERGVRKHICLKKFLMENNSKEEEYTLDI